MVDLSSLKDVAQQAPGAWSPLTAESLAGPPTTVFCFDQSLTSTGVVVLDRDHDGSILVSRSETIRPKSEQSSFEEDYERALQVEDEVAEVLLSVTDIHYARLVRIVHETPLVLNARTFRTAGPRGGVPGRMAGQSVRSAAHRYGLDAWVRMINSQQAKKLICGNAKADKKEAHAALKTCTWIRGLDQVTNEHERDALLLGLKVMETER